MKNIKIYVLIILAFLICGTTMAQKTGFYWYDLNENSNRLQGKLKGEVYYTNYVANEFHFYHDTWVDATLTLIDGDVLENVKLRYLAYGDEIIGFNQNVGTLFKIEKETVKQFEYKDTKNATQVKFINLCSDSLFNGCRFFEELYSGNSELLAFHYVEQVKVHPYKDQFGLLRDSEFRLNISYFMHDESQGLVRLHRSKRSLVRNFPLNKKEIRKLLRQNKLAVLDQNTFVQAFGLIDQAGLTR